MAALAMSTRIARRERDSSRKDRGEYESATRLWVALSFFYAHGGIRTPGLSLRNDHEADAISRLNKPSDPLMHLLFPCRKVHYKVHDWALCLDHSRAGRREWDSNPRTYTSQRVVRGRKRRDLPGKVAELSCSKSPRFAWDGHRLATARGFSFFAEMQEAN